MDSRNNCVPFCAIALGVCTWAPAASDDRALGVDAGAAGAAGTAGASARNSDFDHHRSCRAALVLSYALRSIYRLGELRHEMESDRLLCPTSTVTSPTPAPTKPRVWFTGSLCHSRIPAFSLCACQASACSMGPACRRSVCSEFDPAEHFHVHRASFCVSVGKRYSTTVRLYTGTCGTAFDLHTCSVVLRRNYSGPSYPQYFIYYVRKLCVVTLSSFDTERPQSGRTSFEIKYFSVLNRPGWLLSGARYCLYCKYRI